MSKNRGSDICKEAAELVAKLRHLVNERRASRNDAAARKMISAEIFNMVSGNDAWLIRQIPKFVWLDVCESVHANVDWYEDVYCVPLDPKNRNLDTPIPYKLVDRKPSVLSTIYRTPKGWWYRNPDTLKHKGPFASISETIEKIKKAGFHPKKEDKPRSTVWLFRRKEGWFYTAPTGTDYGPYKSKRIAIERAKGCGYGIENDGRTAYVFKKGRQYWYYDEKDPDATGYVGPFNTRKEATEVAKSEGFKVVYS